MPSLQKYHDLIGKMLVVRHWVHADTIPSFGRGWNVILNGEVNASLSDGDSSSFIRLQAMVDEIKKKVEGFVCIDYEGGRICRWGGDMPSMPSAYALSLASDRLGQAGEIMGRQLAAVGADMVLAPVLDNGGSRSAFPSRCYGDCAEDVNERVVPVLNGLNRHVWTCSKHFPNHGAVSGDSHGELPECLYDKAVLESKYLPQFDRTIQCVNAVMTAHILVPDWDADNPATFSESILGRLREKSEDVLIMADSLTMGAVVKKYAGRPSEVALAAIRAGVDLLITGSWTVDEVAELQNELAKIAVDDKALRQRIKASAKRVDALMTKRRNSHAGEDLKALAEEAGTIAAEVAERALFTKAPFVNPGFIHSSQTLVVAPKLMKEKVIDGYKGAFSIQPNTIFWEGVSPTLKEADVIARQADTMTDVVVVTYNGDRADMQQNLVRRLTNCRLRVCETNFAHDMMSWVPPRVDAVCTYSGDPVSLSVAFKAFAKQPRQLAADTI